MGERDAMRVGRDTTGNHNNDAGQVLLAAAQRQMLGSGGAPDTLVDQISRIGQVTVEGAAYALPGIVHAIGHDLSHPDELAGKLAGAATFGTLMRVLLPAGGVGKAVAGTIMLGYFIYDAARPMWQAWREAASTTDRNRLTESAQRLGDGLGRFAVDAYIGAKVGVWAEGRIGAVLENGLGPRFIAGKELFWNSNRSPIGWTLNRIANTADSTSFAIRDRLAPEPRIVRLSDQEALTALDEAARGLHRSFQDGGFYKKAQFGELMDELTGQPPTSGQARPIEIQIGPPRLDLRNEIWQQSRPRDHSPTPSGLVDGEHRRVTGPTDQITPPSERGLGTYNFETELSPDVIGKVAQVARERMARWTDEAAQISDLRDGFRAPVRSVSDRTRNGALLRPEFDTSRDDILALADKVQTVDHVKEAGMILRLHEMAAKQIELGDPLVLSLNQFADHMHGKFVRMMRDGNIENNILDGKVPSVVTVAHDQGAGNFTIPAIDNVLRRPVTVFPRNQTELESVLAGINWHENLGHDHIYPELARFPDQYRSTVLDEAIQRAMARNNIQDTAMVVEGRQMQKSEVFKQLLLAQANENTADMIGTAEGTVGTPLTLAILLASIRRGGVLETRNVSGSQFEHTFEPHGFDGWRLLDCAEVVRRLGGNDPDARSFADALAKFSRTGSRSGPDYVIASLEDAHRGQMLRVNRTEWDAVAPEIVRAQFDTPLPSFRTASGEMKSMGQMVNDFVPNFRRTNELATRMADTVTQGGGQLSGRFDPATFTSEYDIGQVYNAGTLAWLRATARGEDASKALDIISGLSQNLRSLYRTNNPHAVPLTPTAWDQMKTHPFRTVGSGIAIGTGRLVGQQRAVREWTIRNGTWMAGADGAFLGPYLSDGVHNTLDHILH